MTASPHLDDWDTLSAAWRSPSAEEPIAIDGLRRMVHRRQREMVALVVGEVAITILVGAMVLRVLRGGFTRSAVAAAALAIVVAAIVWAFTIWNRRGSWRPLAETTREYLRLSRERIVAGRRTVLFVRASVSIYTVAYGGWFVARVSRHSLGNEERTIWLFAAAYCWLLVVWSVWYARRLTREREQIESIARSLGLSEAA